MKLLLKAIYFVAALILLIYVTPPSQGFPPPPEGATQSQEPADVESAYRRAYFTDLTREEVISHYKNSFIGVITLRLNYPPEDAQTIIRDQTRSYYLEELSHPLRESLYINGFVPQQEKDAILIDGVEYYQKITVKYVPSLSWHRAVYVIVLSFLAYFVTLEFIRLLHAMVRHFLKTKS